MARTRKKQNRAAVQKLLQELEDVLGAFGWYGIDSAVPANGGSAQQAAREAPTLERPPVAAGLEPPAANEGPEEADTTGETEETSDDTEDYDDGGYSETWYYDPWDIQSALDTAMSNLLKSNLVSEFRDAKQAPSFYEACETLFGANHEITKQAEYFEELIKGYEDRIAKDDLREAYGTLESLMKDMGWQGESA